MSPIWRSPLSVEDMTAMCAGTAVSHLGIEFLEVGDDFLRARMPVDARTRQPYGILHGGASAVLAETLGSIGAVHAAEPGRKVVGLEINANHVRTVTAGWVTGTARPLHVGRTTQVWQIEIVDGRGRLVCVSRLTLAVLG
ncbi:MAG: hotdog fold thioesterase [Holophaga sp.]|jgi:uncharacterized protein (TIGR00369 family)